MTGWLPLSGGDALSWSRTGPRPEGTLSFVEIMILRRKARGETDAEVGAALDLTRVAVSVRLQGIRRRFGGVHTTAELLALPRIQELIKEEGS